MLTVWSRRYNHVVWYLWLLLLVFIPVTSFTPLSSRLNDTPVSPLALFPLLLISLFWFVPYLLRGGKLPAISAPLLIFCLFALFSTCLAPILPLYPYKEQSIFSREIRALITLAIGILFYLCGSILPSTDTRRHSSLKAIYLGAFFMLLWSSLQVWFILDGIHEIPAWFNNLHRMFSIRDLMRDRIVGLSYEPSWVGDQLVLLYIPLWLSSILQGYSIFPIYKKFISLELILALWGFLIFVFSRSRISYASMALILGVLFLTGCWRLSGWLVRKILRSERGEITRRRWITRVLMISVGLFLMGLVLLPAARLVSQVDRRMDDLAIIPSQMEEIRSLYPGEVTYKVTDRLAFAERIMFWTAGFRVFEEFPILGVGLGNAGFLFEANIPAYGYRLTEIRIALDPNNLNFLNPKNLWIRLLAETGIVGFSSFLSWLVLLGFAGLHLMRHENKSIRMLGLAGILAFLAELIEGFSLDTFALPQMWIIFGLISGVTWNHNRDDSASSYAESKAPNCLEK